MSQNLSSAAVVIGALRVNHTDGNYSFPYPWREFLFWIWYFFYSTLSPDRRQSKALLTIDERGSKTARNSVLDCHLSPVWRQMAIENSVSNDFLSTFFDIINVFDCPLPCVECTALGS